MRSSLGIRLVIGYFLSGCAVAQARIGETEKQCEERYGKPTAPHDGDKSKWMYKKGDMVVLAHFHEGKCDYIMFWKMDPATFTKAEISENEQEVLLKANGGGKEWKKIEGVTESEFMTKDSELRAQYAKLDRSLIVITRDAVLRRDAARKAAEEKKLKGF